jgi:hypothetical protein
MKKAHYIIIIVIILFGLNSYGQCLCGNIQLQMSIDDLSFRNDSSNYELIIIEKPERLSFDSRILNKSYFSNDTLNLNFSTGTGIKKLKIELKNKINASSMQLTILNMAYDNNYFIDLSKFISGNYIFDWEKIDACQTQNKTSRIVECQGMKFVQLDLQSEGLIFNHNKIKPLLLENFSNKNDDLIKTGNNNTKSKIKSRIESLYLSEIDSIYHLENERYLFTQKNVVGNGNHYYDEIKLRIISFSENKITLYPIDIEVKSGNGYLDENGCLIITQHQNYNFEHNMFIYYDESRQTLVYQFTDVNIQTNENLADLKNIKYKFLEGRFEFISESSKEIKIE